MGTSSENIYQWQKSIWEDAQYTSLGNCRLETGHLVPIRKVKSPKHWHHPNVGKDVEQQELLLVADGMQNRYGHLEGSLAFSYKSKHTLTYHLAIAFFNIYSKELKTYIHTKTCMWMFKALFIASKTWQQLRCPSAGKWINNGTFRHQDIIQH